MINADTALSIAAESRLVKPSVLATKYGVTETVIRRIRKGEAWGAVTGIRKHVVADRFYTSAVASVLASRDYGRFALLEDFFGFCLYPSNSLGWACFGTPDGMGYTTTNGYIAWSCPELYEYAKGMEGSVELPWLSSSRIMQGGVGELYKGPIDENYRRLARLRGLEVRESMGDKPWLYLTENLGDGDHRIYAAVGI
jgi:hypothetical protein